MELPQLPTDNLYKFLALSGITLIVISMVPFLHAYRLQIEVIRLNGDIKVLEEQIAFAKVDMEFLQSDTSRLKERVDKMKEDVFQRLPEEREKETWEEYRAEVTKDVWDTIDDRRELERRLERIKEISQKQSISSLQLEAKNREHQYIRRVVGCEFTAGAFALISGLIIAYKGFTLWYGKLQVLEDKTLQMRAEGKQP